MDSALGGASVASLTPEVSSGAGGGFLGNLGGFLDTLTSSDILQTGLSAAALQDQMSRLSGIGSGLAAGAREIGREAQAASAFRPFTVSTGFGGVQATPEGGFATTLSPAMAAQQQALQGITSGLLGGMGGMGVDYARQPGDPGYFTGGPVRPRNLSQPPPPNILRLTQAGPSPAQRFQLRPTATNRFGTGPASFEDLLTGEVVSQEQMEAIQAQGPDPRLADPTAFRNLVDERIQRQGQDLLTAQQRALGQQPSQAPTSLNPFAGMSPEELKSRLEYERTNPEEFRQSIMPVMPQPQPMAPMTPATGGFGAGIPDVSGIQRQALGGVGGFLTGAMAPMAQREADVYERIRATQRPEEQRQQLALEERLAAQGRTGLRTAQFGGSPEQFALAQAQEEAKARASLGALGQAQAEQLQQAGLAESMFGLGSGAAALPASLQQAQLGNIGAALGLQYLPEQQLLSSLDPAVNLANIAGTGQRQGAGYLAQAGTTGLEALGQTEIARANLLRDLYSGLLAQQTSAETGERQESIAGGLFGDLLSGIGTLFGGQ
jgi:hypothetical protein